MFLKEMNAVCSCAETRKHNAGDSGSCILCFIVRCKWGCFYRRSLTLTACRSDIAIAAPQCIFEICQQRCLAARCATVSLHHRHGRFSLFRPFILEEKRVYQRDDSGVLQRNKIAKLIFEG